MKITAPELTGINIEVDALVRLRAELSGTKLADVLRRMSPDTGSRKTRITARGMEYLESRAYVPGDDIRTMDWRVMARTGEPHSKLFVEEKERRFLLAVDMSPSMFFGTRYSFKSWTAAHTAAYLGWLASIDGDRIGGMVLAPDFHAEVRPGRTRSGLMSMFHQLAAAGVAGETPDCEDNRLNDLLGELNRVVKPGSIVSLISDFTGIDEQTPELLASLLQHNDVYGFWVHDDTEVKPWPSGFYPVLTEGENIGLQVESGPGKTWLARLQAEHEQQIKQLTTRLNLPLLPVSCNLDTAKQILVGSRSR